MFNPGDLVKLKSGSPVMTVRSTRADQVYCSWFAGSKASNGQFNKDMLLKVEDDEKGKK